jgi:hypothetical protein
MSDMLDHADAYHAIELPRNFAVIAQLDFDVQSATPTLRVLELFSRNSEPDYLATVSDRRIAGQSAPAAADVEQAQTRPQTESLANPLQFPNLGGGQIIAFIEQSARILHVWIEHRFEKIIT